MLDVLELEKKWDKYHSKQMLPVYITTAISITLVSVVIIFYVLYPNIFMSLIREPQLVSKPLAVPENNRSVQPVKKKIVQQKIEQNVLVPSFNFIYNLEDQMINYNNAQLMASVAADKNSADEQAPIKSKPKQKVKQAVKKAKKPIKKKVRPKKKPVTKKTVVKPKQKPKKVPKIQTVVLGAQSTRSADTAPQQALVKMDSTSESELRSVIKRFNKTQKPALSLFIAKKYYDNGNYNESLNYAKKTYKINPDIEDGVLLYARSLVKLGKKETAISKLKSYIDRSGSVNARILLGEIKQGNFK